MKSFQTKTLPTKKTKAPELNNVTVIASKGLGRVRHFNVNFFVLLGILTVLVVYFAFSFMLLIWFFGEHHQENLLVKLEKDFLETQKALYQAKQRLKFLENYIDPSKIPAESPNKTLTSQSPPMDNKKPRGTESDATKASTTQSTIVRIKDLKINHRGNSLSVNFKLARASYGRTPLRGHIFVIAVDRSTDPPQLWPSPKAAFENGTPVNPKRGQAYKIRNFRRIRARWSFASSQKLPSELRILVYDQTGGLLLEEDYRLEKDQTP
jgi:hypothetical protein